MLFPPRVPRFALYPRFAFRDARLIYERRSTRYEMDDVVRDALRRLESAPEVYFDLVVVPTGATGGVYTFAVPPNGDLATRLTVRGSAIREARVEIMGDDVCVWTSAAFQPNVAVAEIPVKGTRGGAVPPLNPDVQLGEAASRPVFV